MTHFEKLTSFDREIWGEELEAFVPEKVFDVHTHLWDNRFAPSADCRLWNTDFPALDKWSKEIFPGRKLEYLLLGFPLAGMKLDGFHEFMAEEIAKSNLHLGSTIVTPEMSAGELDDLIGKYHFCGVKPYRTFAADPANCRITDYFPEELIEVANERKLCVTMHMAKFDGIADKENMDDLQYLTAKYPGVRWILAHCARAFNAYSLGKSIFFLRDLPNIYYDLSAVCDVYAIWLLFKYEDIKRIMFGTDNVISGGMRGNYITWGRGWQYFPGMDVPHCCGKATLVCYENLRAIRRAADMAELNLSQIGDIFYNNAIKFFDLEMSR